MLHHMIIASGYNVIILYYSACDSNLLEGLRPQLARAAHAVRVPRVASLVERFVYIYIYIFIYLFIYA